MVWEWLAVAAIFLGTSLISAYTQSPVTYNHGEGWDGTNYCAMARCFAAGRRPAAEAPFVNRLAAPFLAAVINPRDPIAGFRVLDVVTSALVIVLFVFWLRLHISDWRVRVLMVCLYCITFFNPVRFLYYYPATTDSITHLAVLAACLLLHRLERARLPVVVLSMTVFTMLAVTAREFMLMFAIAPLLFGTAVTADSRAPFFVTRVRMPSLWLLVPVIAGAGVLLAIRFWVITVPSGYHFTEHIALMMYNKSLVPYLHGWFIAYGPVLALLFWKPREWAAYLWARQWMLAMFLGIAVLGWIAGTDTERFLAWSFPFTFMLLGRVIEQNWRLLRSPFLIAALGVSQAIAQRAFWPTPDFPPKVLARYWVVLTMWGTRINMLDLYSWHAPRRNLAFLSFAEYVALSAAVVLWLRYAESRHARAATARMAKVA